MRDEVATGQYSPGFVVGAETHETSSKFDLNVCRDLDKETANQLQPLTTIPIIRLG